MLTTTIIAGIYFFYLNHSCHAIFHPVLSIEKNQWTTNARRCEATFS